MTYNQLISHYGTQADAARALDCGRQRINNWQHTGIPMGAQAIIQLKTGGKLKADMSKRKAAS